MNHGSGTAPPRRIFQYRGGCKAERFSRLPSFQTDARCQLFPLEQEIPTVSNFLPFSDTLRLAIYESQINAIINHKKMKDSSNTHKLKPTPQSSQTCFNNRILRSNINNPTDPPHKESKEHSPIFLSSNPCTTRSFTLSTPETTTAVIQ